jgi:TatD DNase family protein
VAGWREAIEEAAAAGVSALIAVGTDAARNRTARDMAETDRRVYFAAGHYPENDAAPDVTALRELLAHPRCVAVGEVGLVFGPGYAPPDRQVDWLETMLDLAEEFALPVSMHVRGTEREAYDAIRRRSRLRGVWHYFAGDREWAERFLDAGFHLSFSGLVTRPSRDALRDVARQCPADRLLLETDAPWGSPQSRKGLPNRPAYLVDTAEVVAGVRGMTLAEIAAIEADNARKLFQKLGDL